MYKALVLIVSTVLIPQALAAQAVCSPGDLAIGTDDIGPPSHEVSQQLVFNGLYELADTSLNSQRQRLHFGTTTAISSTPYRLVLTSAVPTMVVRL